MGDSLAMNRNIANLQARIKRIEEALLALNVAGNSPQASNFPTRSSIDLGEVRIGDEMKQASSMLASLYTSETGQLTQFGVGTWPEDKYVSGAVTIHGAIQDATGQPLEIMRATLIPALLHAGIPFSNVNVDHDQQLPVDKTREIVGACASHLVMLTPGLPNYRRVSLFVSRVVVGARLTPYLFLLTEQGSHHLRLHRREGKRQPSHRVLWSQPSHRARGRRHTQRGGRLHAAHQQRSRCRRRQHPKFFSRHRREKIQQALRASSCCFSSLSPLARSRSLSHITFRARRRMRTTRSAKPS